MLSSSALSVPWAKRMASGLERTAVRLLPGIVRRCGKEAGVGGEREGKLGEEALVSCYIYIVKRIAVVNWVVIPSEAALLVASWDNLMAVRWSSRDHTRQH